MKEQLEKSLVTIRKNGIFDRIKNFFLNLFGEKENTESELKIEHIEPNKIEYKNKQKDSFIESIKNTEDDETKLLKLQKQFDNYEIEASDLSDKQIADLTELYEKQIEILEKSNKARMERIRQHKDGELLLQSIKIDY